MSAAISSDKEFTSSTSVSRASEYRWSRSDISPLRYPGGKRKLAPVLADLIEKSDLNVELLVEPFAGGSAVSIALLEAGVVKQVGLSDIDPLIASFWSTVFSDSACDLVEIMSQTEVTLEEWHRQKSLTPATELEAAFKCLFLNRTSFSGILRNEAGPIGGKRQDGNNKIDCRFNKKRIGERILELSKLRGRVRFVRCASYREVIGQVKRMKMSKDNPKGVLWYLDPPYFEKASRLYRHSFTEHQHELLREDLDKLEHNWILSYDNHVRALQLYGDHPAFRTVGLMYSAKVNSVDRAIANEILVINTAPHDHPIILPNR